MSKEIKEKKVDETTVNNEDLGAVSGGAVDVHLPMTKKREIEGKALEKFLKRGDEWKSRKFW